MSESTIALYSEYFNILSATVMAFFAIYGLITVFWKNSSLNFFRGRVFIQAFCVAALLALVVESTFFNFQYYLKYFSDGEFHTTELSPTDSTVILTSDLSVTAKIRADRKIVRHIPQQYYQGPPPREITVDTVMVASQIVFSNIDRRVSSIYIEPVFGNSNSMALVFEINDDEGRKAGITYLLQKGFPRGNYFPLQLCGNLKDITISYPGEELTSKVSQITFNRQIPFYFSGLRLFAVSCLFFAIIVCVRKKLRARAAHLLFEYKFDPLDKRQNRIYAFMVVVVILFSFVCAFTSTTKFWREEYVTDWHYNIFLVDAILDGRTYLDAGRPEMLLVAEHPYDNAWLEANGYARDSWWYSDWAWYEGKHYCYFGIVPAIILFVPYKMITGDYLPNFAGIFIFTAISVILMAMLWRHCVKKYLQNARFVFYLLGFLTLFFVSGQFVPLRFTRYYSIVSSAGLMFSIAGILLLLKSVENAVRPKGIKLFFACLCFALAVGCRPNLVLVSLIVPVVLWKYKSFRTAAIVAIPYILVAIPLCYYNYIRFGSITDFGFKYNMTNLNTAKHALMSPFGKLINTFIASMTYLFTFCRLSFAFPYVESQSHAGDLTLLIRAFKDRGVGMINFPIVFCLYFYFKTLFVKAKPKSFTLTSTFMVIAAATILLNSYLVGHSGRYVIDFAFFMIWASIFSAYYWCNNEYRCGNIGNGTLKSCDYVTRLRLKVTYVLLALSIFVGACLFAGRITNDITPSNPVLFRYLKYSLGVVGWV